MIYTFQWFSWEWYFLPTIAYIQKDTWEKVFVDTFLIAFLCVKFTVE